MKVSFVRGCPGRTVGGALIVIATSLAFVPRTFGFDDAAPAQRGVGLAANQQLLWLWQRDSGADRAALNRFAYRSADPKAKPEFVPLPAPPVLGQIVCASVCGDDLHLFFRDGAHFRYTKTPTAWRDTEPVVQFTERTLPNSAIPLALVADAARGVLYALISQRQAATLPADAGPATIVAETADSRSDDSVQDKAPSAPQTVIARYEQGEWRLDRNGPADVSLHDDVLYLLAANKVLHLWCRAAGHSEIRHRISQDTQSSWIDGSPLNVPQSAQRFEGGWLDTHPVLIWFDDDGRERRIACATWVDGRWQSLPELHDQQGATARFGASAAAGLFGGQVAVADIDEHNVVRFGTWDARTGAMTEPPAPIHALDGNATYPTRPLGRIIAQWVLFVGILVVTMVWRREAFFGRSVETGELAYARIGRRAFADAIDLAIASPAWLAVLYVLVGGFAGLSTALTGEVMQMGAFSSRMYWAQASVGSVMAVYGFVVEAVPSARRGSLGKRAAGIWVVREDGSACRWGVILVRNAARVLEFHIMPLAILILLTPARQRLGDLLARTVVVRDAEHDEPTESLSERDEES